MKLKKIAYLNIPKGEYLMGVTTKGTQKARLQSGTYTSGYKREGIPEDEASHNFWAQSKDFRFTSSSTKLARTPITKFYPRELF